jgi:HEAT repeat protein
MRSMTLILATPFLAASLYGSPQGGHVALRCHRTANQDVPENTLESLEQAALMGCDVIEVDVRRTLDGRFVLNHDGFLERLTDGEGEIETSLYDDLRMRDAGSWMSDRFTGMRIPTFEDALRLARERRVRLFLDMKDKGIGAELLEILKREKMLDQVEFGGEWDDVKQLYPQANHTDRPAQWVSPDITAEKIAAYHRDGKDVIVNFSANGHEMDFAGMKAVVAAGADGINVDFPRLGADAVGRPVEGRIRELINEAAAGKSEDRIKAILKLTQYRVFPLNDVFARWLLDEDANVSRASAVALVTMRPRVSLEIFRPALHSAYAPVRANAVWALGVLQAPSAMLVPFLKDTDSQVLSETLVALSYMPGAVDEKQLLVLLADKNSAVRGAAALALAKHHPETAANAISTQIRHEAADEGAVHQRHTANGNGSYSQPEIDELTGEFKCQMEMLRALHMLGDANALHELEAEAFGPDSSFPEPNGAVAALMLWDNLANDPTLAVKNLGATDTQAADRAEWALVHAEDKVLPDVREALKSSNPQVSMRAIQIAGWRADEGSLQTLHLIEAAHGPNAELAAWAIEKITALHPVSQ